MIKIHHVATDGWSQRLFWKELEALFCRQNGTPAELSSPNFPISKLFRVAAGMAANAGGKEQLNYWRTQLEGLTELPLRTDRPRPKSRTGRGARHFFRLSRALSTALKSLSRTQGVTLFMTLLGAFQCLLYRYTNHDDVAVGSLIANRNQIQTEQLIGMFANTIVLRTNLQAIRRSARSCGASGKLRLRPIGTRICPSRKSCEFSRFRAALDRNPLFQIMFILQTASIGAPTLPGLSINFWKSILESRAST